MKKFDFKKYIDNSNEQFLNASAAEKRVIIAQDVILRLKKKNLVADTGKFIVSTSDIFLNTLNENNSFKDEFNKGENECMACAKGSLFCSIIGRVNEMDMRVVRQSFVGGDNNGTRSHRKLLEYFSVEQLDMIETAFENRSYLLVIDMTTRNKCHNFFKIYSAANDRLIAICKNIVKNKGEFVL